MEYFILGEKIQFSEEQMNWFRIKKFFDGIEFNARQTLKKGHSKCNKLEVLNDLMFSAYYDDICMPTAIFLEEQRIYTVTHKTLMDKMQLYYDGTMRRILGEYISEVGDVEDDKQQGKIGSLEASSRVSKIIKDEGHFSRLLDATALFCELVRDYCIDCIEAETGKCYETVSENDEQITDAIIENMIMGKIKKEDLEECCKKVFRLNPSSSAVLYRVAISKFGDKDKEIEKLGTDIGYDISVIKKNCIDEIYKDRDFKNVQFDVEQEQVLLDLLQEVKGSCEKIGIDTCGYIDILNEKWSVLDEKIRTVEGVTYDTREKAQQIKQDISLFEEYTSKQNYDDINILDVGIYNNCVEDIYNLSYITEEFRNMAKERAQLYMQRYMNHHITRNKLANPATFMTEFNNMIYQTGFYRKNQKKIHFNDYANDKKNSAPAITTYKGTPILYQENPKLMERNRGIVYTTQEVVVYDKKNLNIIPLNDIDTVRFSEEGNFQVISKNGVLDFGTISGIDHKELRDEYIRVMDSIVYALSKLEIKPQIVTMPVNRVEPILQQTNIPDVNMQQPVYSQNTNNAMGNMNQPKKEKSKARIVLIVIAAIGAIAFFLIVMFIVLIGLLVVVSEDESQYSESTVIESTIPEESGLAVMPAEEIPVAEEIQTSNVDLMTEEIMNVEESAYTGSYDYLQDFTYIYDIYEGIPALNSYEEYEPFYKKQYERWVSGEDYSYILLDMFGKLYVDLQLYDSQIEYVGTWWDEDSQRCNMTITESGEGYMIDILWSNSAYETFHWSYYGECNNEKNCIYCTQGCMFSEVTLDNGEVIEGLEYADGTATLWLDSEGILYWNDDVRDSGDSCYFKKSSGIY